MCGIAGIVRFDQQAVDQCLLSKMAELQRHRGPDDEGFYCDDRVGLAFRRLAILDLSAAGHQPMASADKSCWLIYNGEIYNHAEIRKDLIECGHHFHSRSDTEVILAAYQQWGVDCLSRFNGMWAFALWDRKKQQLFCARDRVGVKPFYYHLNAKRFLYASEIKALFADPTTPRTADEQSVYTYLVYGLVHFGEATFFQEIKQLPAAHYMLVNAQGVQMRRYWQVDHGQYSSNIKDVDAIEGFRHLFFDSVRLRLQSDVAIGTCLSGGLDSSAIVCVANDILFGKEKPHRTVVGEKQKAFSACYADKQIDERSWIEFVIAKTGAQSYLIFPDAHGLFTDLEAMIYHQDEPVASSSIYAQWCVMRRARAEGVVVMLDGQGGDEVMCGYQRYYWSYLAGLLRSLDLKAFVRESSKPWGTHTSATKSDWLGLAYTLLPIPLQDKLYFQRKYRQSASWLGNGLQHKYAYQQGRSDHPTWLGQALERDLFADSLPALLKYEDRNSMAHSIEARVPFLDYRLIEFMASLPDHMKIRHGLTKWLLRQALGELLPREISQRRNKLGFATPERAWLSQQVPQIQQKLQASRVVQLGWLESSALHETQTLAALSESEYGSLIWRWLNLEIWLRAFVH